MVKEYPTIGLVCHIHLDRYFEDLGFSIKPKKPATMYVIKKFICELRGING